MIDFYRPFYQLALSRIDPERAHRLAIAALHTAQSIPKSNQLLRRLRPTADERLKTTVCGLTFENPLGVAAGLDKNAEAVSALHALGFGHIEVGTVTMRPQLGNARPRVWRVPEQSALINALGFPSDGAEAVVQRLCPAMVARRLNKGDAHGIVGVNLGKNADTPLERASHDYSDLIEAVFQVADYLVINVSSPNTAGLRQLQGTDRLAELLKQAIEANKATAAACRSKVRPLLVKLAPDLTANQLEEIADFAVSAGADGIIATNTTTDRSALAAEHQQRPGGLSGTPLYRRANQVIAQLYATVGKRVPIIGVGGVATADDVLGHIRAGASLVQLYTAFVYSGPALPGQILRGLSTAADQQGWRSIAELVGG